SRLVPGWLYSTETTGFSSLIGHWPRRRGTRCPRAERHLRRVSWLSDIIITARRLTNPVDGPSRIANVAEDRCERAAFLEVFQETGQDLRLACRGQAWINSQKGIHTGTP